MALLYTLEEAAGVLGLTPGALRSKVQSGEIRAILRGGALQLRATDVHEMARDRGLRGPEPIAVLVATPSSTATATATASTVRSPRTRIPPPEAAADLPEAPPAPADRQTPTAPRRSRPRPATAQEPGDAASRGARTGPVALAPAPPSGRADAFPAAAVPGPTIAEPVAPPPDPAPSVAPKAEAPAAPKPEAQTAADEPTGLKSLNDLLWETLARSAEAEMAALDAAPPRADGVAETHREDAADEEADEPGEIGVTCPNPSCGTRGQVPSDMVGQTLDCRKCGTEFYIDPITRQSLPGPWITPAPPAATDFPSRGRRGPRRSPRAWWSDLDPDERRTQSRRAAVAGVLIAAGASVFLMRPGPVLPSILPARARYVAEALAMNDPGQARAICLSGTGSDASRWLAQVRPKSWPATVKGMRIEVEVRNTSTKQQRSALVEVALALPGTTATNAAPAAPAAGPPRRKDEPNMPAQAVVDTGGAAWTKVRMVWVADRDGQWWLDGTTTLRRSQPRPGS